MAVPRHADAIRIGNTQPHRLIDRRLRVGHQLFQYTCHTLSSDHPQSETTRYQ